MNCWIIAVACNLINFLLLGVARLVPLLFVASMERYNVNRAEASLPFVLCYIIRTISGPVIGFMGQRFGLRATTLFGCFSSFVGIGACYAAEDIDTINILWGGIYGFGFGFGTALLPIILDHAFDDKNKTKANGLALAGSSLGGILMPPLIQASIKEYGLSGSFLIISALILHAVPASLIASSSNSKKTFEGKQKYQRTSNSDSPQNKGSAFKTGKYSNPRCSSYSERADTTLSTTTGISQQASVLNMNTSMNGQDHLSLKILGTMCSENETELTNFGGIEVERNSLSNRNYKNVQHSKERSGASNYLHVSLLNDDDYNNGIICEPKKDSQSVEKIMTKKKDERGKASAFRSLGIFVDPTFLTIMITQSSYAFGIMILWTIIVDVARDKGIDRSIEIYCATFIALSDMIGRLSLGWITDRGYLSTTKFCLTWFSLLGLSYLLFICVHGVTLLLLNIFLFGFVSGGLISVFPSVVCEFISTRNKMMAMSCRMLLLAPMGLAASPLIGYFREQRGSYDGIFYMTGIMSILCGGISTLIPQFSQRFKSRELQ